MKYYKLDKMDGKILEVSKESAIKKVKTALKLYMISTQKFYKVKI